MSEKAVLDREYAALKDETQKVEQIRRSVAEIMRSDARERTVTKKREAER